MEASSQRRIFFLGLSFLFCSALIGQITRADYYNKIDNKIFVISKNRSLSFDSLVTIINYMYTAQEERVRAYYTWTALNIVYDKARLDAFQEGLKLYTHKDLSQDPDTVFRRRKAVCEGFSRLMNKFCEASGIPSHMVIGYSKSPEGEIVRDILHAWNAVKVNESWRLLDVTWSNGYVGMYNQYYTHFSDKYFIESTPDFHIDHLPLDPQWQLSEKPISKNYFFTADSLDRYYTRHPFVYSDSISAYKKRTRDDQEWLDYIHYYCFDRENMDYLNEADYKVYYKANDIYTDAALDFEEYRLFYLNTLSVAKTPDNYKKARALLEASKNRHIQVVNYLANKRAYASSVNDKLERIRKQTESNLGVINTLLAQNKPQKKAPVKPAK